MSAISATARKLAVIIWNRVVKGCQYINPAGYLFLDQKRKLGLVKRIQKQIDKFDLTKEDLGFVTSWLWNNFEIQKNNWVTMIPTGYKIINRNMSGLHPDWIGTAIIPFWTIFRLRSIPRISTLLIFEVWKIQKRTYWLR